MKLIGILLSIALSVGLFVLYVMGVAFRLDLLTAEMIGHVAIRFAAGFLILGFGVFYEHLFRLKHSLWFILTLFLADDVYDYYRNVDSFKFEMLILSIYMLLWGALIGYLTMKALKIRRLN